MPDNTKHNIIIRCTIRGFYAGLICILLYIGCAIFFNESPFTEVIYYIVLLLAKPLLFIWPEDQFTDSMLEGLVLLIISVLSMASLYGFIIGTVIKLVETLKKRMPGSARSK